MYIKLYYRIILKGLLAILIIVIWVQSLFYIMENRDKIVFMYLLYDCIEYNGNKYYISDNQHLSCQNSKVIAPVYLVYKGDKIYFEECDSALLLTDYEDGEEGIYILFDSTIYVREDYLDGTE